jgi:hypothetical protein
MFGNDFCVFSYSPLVVVPGHYDRTDLVHRGEHLSRVSDVEAKKVAGFCLPQFIRKEKKERKRGLIIGNPTVSVHP